MVLSVEDMLNNAAEAAKAARAGRAAPGASKVQQLLAGREEVTDTVQLSPVAKLLQQQQAEAAKTSTPYTEQDWYINAKVTQLRAQLQIYSNLPGLDPSGSIMKSLEEEIIGLAKMQEDKLKESEAEAEAAQKKLAEQEAQKARDAETPDVDTLLKRAAARANGEYVADYTNPVTSADADKAKNDAVEAMLKKVREGVNTTA